MSTRPSLTPEFLLDVYARGYFPMADDRHATELFWVDPERRGILPLDAFHLPRRLGRTVRQDRFGVTVDRDFTQVIEACAAAGEGRARTWINDEIIAAYTALHRAGHAHSVETRDAQGRLVGGLYGVRLGGAFFGESMFSRATDASKVALVHLVARLRTGGFGLLDTQFTTTHLQQFGTVEIPRDEYRARLQQALPLDADFYRLPPMLDGATALQSITQTS